MAVLGFLIKRYGSSSTPHTILQREIGYVSNILTIELRTGILREYFFSAFIIWTMADTTNKLMQFQLWSGLIGFKLKPELRLAQRSKSTKVGTERLAKRLEWSGGEKGEIFG